MLKLPTKYPRIILSGGLLQGAAMPQIVYDFQKAVVGRTIKAAGYYQESAGDEVIPCIELDNGSIILSSADDEDNGPGCLCLHQQRSDGRLMLCECEAKS